MSDYLQEVLEERMKALEEELDARQRLQKVLLHISAWATLTPLALFFRWLMLTLKGGCA